MTSRAGERLAGIAHTQDDSHEVSPRPRAAPWLAALLACAVAGGAGYTFGRRTTPAPKPLVREEASERDQRIDVLLAGQGDLRQRLARVEALMAAGAKVAPSAAPEATIASAPDTPSDDGEPPPSAEAIAALDSAHVIVDDAIRNGRWTENDRDRMRQVFGPIGDEGRKAILKELVQAINSGKLSAQGLRGPPL